MLNNKTEKYLTLIIIILGFFYSCFIGYKNINKYDVLKNIDGKIQNTYFFEKEGGTPSHWHEADKILKQKKDNSYLFSENKYEFNYLPPRLVYLYYNFINKDIKGKINKNNEEVFITSNNKFGLLLIFNLFYLICLINLYISLKKNFSNLNILSLLTIFFFLSFEPTLNQWNRVLYSETIFFGLQILILSLLISYDENTSNNKIIILGILLSLMYLQRTVSIYYVLIVIIYFYIFFKKKFLVNTIIIGILYLSTHLFIGFQNFNRDGKMYFLPILAKEDMYGYFIPKILKYNDDGDYVKNFKTRHDKLNNYVKKNNLESESNIPIQDRQKIANNNFFESIRLISQYPIGSIKEYLISLTHYFLMKPNEIHYLQENSISYDNQFYKSQQFKNELIFKLLYSIIIYSLVVIGLFFILKNKNFKILYLLFSSILYFSIPVVWHKQSSYLAPILIYISIFFGIGFANLSNILIKLQNDR